MEIALDMVVENAVPFELFSVKPMKALINLAEKGAKESASNANNPAILKLSLLDRAKKQRLEITKILQGKILIILTVPVNGVSVERMFSHLKLVLSN